MRKTLLIDDVMSKISELNKLGDSKSGSVLIHGDTDSSTAMICIKGNYEVLASAFGKIMDSKPEINRLMKAMFGAYLTLNPEQKDDFIKGLGITELPFNLN